MRFVPFWGSHGCSRYWGTLLSLNTLAFFYFQESDTKVSSLEELSQQCRQLQDVVDLNTARSPR